ncbi:hypothetical protein HHK36_000791 [Tetracentron sinense]|uniref:BLOC-1-related complex subunit 7 n=1 Tax=Tetracentron sinense TaxID=13715 RepID=A0A834ZSK4_TETSI|nr:hypothetical protein HHK36_000791 [Tetracentron sinense]
MATSSSSSKPGGVVGKESSRGEATKATVDDHISQAVQSTSNLLHLMQQSSPSQALLIKLPRNLLAKASTIKNTEQVLEQMPQVISSLDAHIENGLQSIPHLKTVIQLLSNMESSQLNPLSQDDQSREELELVDQISVALN